ncbi:hypothetical protein [Vibrio phage BONAISHI]|nr:hypothetical protein [Vibrio phage BONAISHI]
MATAKMSPMARNEEKAKKGWIRYGRKYGFPDCCIEAFCDNKQIRKDSFFSGSGFLRGPCCIDKDPHLILKEIRERRQHHIPFPISSDSLHLCDLGQLLPNWYDEGKEGYKKVCYDEWVKNKYFRKFKTDTTVTVVGSREITNEETSDLYAITSKLINGDIGISTSCAPGSDAAAVRACRDHSVVTGVPLSDVPLQVWMPKESNRGLTVDNKNFFCLDEHMRMFAYAQLKHAGISWIDNMQGIGREYYLRNVYQIHLKDYMRTDLVIFCADENKHGDPKGGTAIAVKVARSLDIQALNIRNENDRKTIKKLLPMI